MTTITTNTRRGGMSVLQVLGNIRGPIDGPVTHSLRPTAHPTGAAWVAPTKRTFASPDRVLNVAQDTDTITIPEAAPTRMAETIPGRLVQLEGLNMLRELAA